MFSALKRTFKIKSLRTRILFTFLMVILVRIGSQIPIPGLNMEIFRQWWESNNNGFMSMLSSLTGGSFERFSIFALGITPYITSSIVLQLLAVVFPSIEEMQKDGNYGKQKFEWLTAGVAIGLSILQAVAITINFNRTGFIPNFNAGKCILIVILLVGGEALLILMGKAIDKKGIGNGISIILAANIIAEIPGSLRNLIVNFTTEKSIPLKILACVIIFAVIALTIILVVIINEAHRKIAIHYSQKFNGSVLSRGVQSFIPIKVNVAGVMPVIFASSLLMIPQLITSFIGKGNSNFFIRMLDQNNWFDFSRPQYSIGIILYIAMLYFFGFYYTSIAFNSKQVSADLKKSGGTIPGIRQGEQTAVYLGKIINRLVFIGTTWLAVLVLIPTFFNGAFHANVSFGGTSLIIVVGVITETLEKVDAELKSRNYNEGFLLGKGKKR